MDSPFFAEKFTKNLQNETKSFTNSPVWEGATPQGGEVRSKSEEVCTRYVRGEIEACGFGEIKPPSYDEFLCVLMMAILAIYFVG